MNWKPILEWILTHRNNKNISENELHFIKDYFKNEVKHEIETKNPKNYLNEKFISFLHKDVYKHNKGLDKFSINKMHPLLLKHVDSTMKDIIDLTRIKDEQLKLELEKRFNHFIRHELQNDTNLQDVKDKVRFNDIKETSSQYRNMVLSDKTHKMNLAIDKAIATENNAFACIWHTQEDKRVVGNPSGLYPKVTNEQAHGNHYKRNNKVFILKNSWAYKQKLVTGDLYEDLADGGVEKAYNCRCYLEYIYDLRDIDEAFLTKKGYDYIYKY